MPVPANCLGITADDWKGFEGAGIRLFDQDGRRIPDTEIDLTLYEACKWFEKQTGIRFYDANEHPNGLRFRVPEEGLVQGVDYDIPIDALDYDGNHFADNRYMLITVPFGPIRAVERLNLGYPGNIQGFEISINRIEFRGQYRQIQVIPILVGAAGTTLAYPSGFYPFGSVPHAIRLTYLGGMSGDDANLEHPNIGRIIRLKAGIEILNIAQNLTDPGLSSRSVGGDGLSQSKSYTQSAVYGLYSATLDKWDKLLKQKMRDFDEYWNGLNIEFVV